MRRPTTIRRSAATATPAASRAASSRRSRPTSRMRPTPARGWSWTASPTACSSPTAGRPGSRRVRARRTASSSTCTSTRRRRGRGGRHRIARRPAALAARRPGGGRVPAAAPDLLRRRRLRRGVNAWDGQFQALASFDFTHVVEGTGFLVESVNVSLPFWAGALAVQRRRGAQGADAAPAQRRLLARRHARPRLGPRRARSRRRAGRPLGARRPGRPAAGGPPARRARAHAPRARRRGDPDVPLGRPHAGAGATTSRPTSRGSSGRRTSAPPTRPTRWAPAAWAPTPRRSVADGYGELHDAAGVWIGDASALPTAPGVNPMLTVMAIARRTAHAILERSAVASSVGVSARRTRRGPARSAPSPR